MTNPLDNNPRTADHAHADQRVDALKAQLAMVQAERALLHANTGRSPSVAPTGPRHGIGGWLFAGFSACVLAGTIMMGVTRPPVVVERVVHVEVPVEVERPVEAAPEVAPEVEVAPEPEPEPTRARRPRRPRTPNTTSDTGGMRVDHTMLNIEACGNDPICGAH